MAGGAGGGGGWVRPGVDVRATVGLVRAREAAAGADQGGAGEGEGEEEAEPLLLPLLGAEEASEEGLVGEAVKVLITQGGGCCGCGGAAGVLPLLRAVWATLRDPHIAMPALFIFLWQSCPSPTSALFYFQVYVLHFSAAFQELVYLAGSFAGVMGVLLYQTALVRAPLKLMLLGCAAAGTALSATQLLLVTRANVRLGISDKVFVLGDYAVLSAIAEVMMTPLLALSARVCPPGVEATLYACLYSLLNLSGALSGALGALLTRLCGVPADPGGDDGGGGGSGGGGASLTLLVALCNACLLLPLPLLAWIPEVAPGAPPPAGLAGVPLRREQQEPAAAAAVVVAVAAGYELCSGGGGDGGDCGGDDEEAGAQGGARAGHRMALQGRRPEKAAGAAGHVQPVASTRPESGCGLATPFAAAAQAPGAAAAAQAAATGCSAADSPADAESPRRRPPLPPTASGALLPPPSPLAGAQSSLRQPLLARHGSSAGAGAQGAGLSPAPSATVLRTHSLGPASGAALSPARAAVAAAAAAAAAVGSVAPRWAGRATGQAALTCVGALAGAQVGVSPLVRMARSRSAALLAAADAAAAAAAAVAETVAGEAEAETAAAAQADEAAEAAEVCVAGGAVAQRAAK